MSNDEKALRKAFMDGYHKAMQWYPVGLGYWKQLKDGGHVCSVCGTPARARHASEYLFCPYCGAKMLEELNAQV